MQNAKILESHIDYCALKGRTRTGQAAPLDSTQGPDDARSNAFKGSKHGGMAAMINGKGQILLAGPHLPLLHYKAGKNKSIGFLVASPPLIKQCPNSA